MKIKKIVDKIVVGNYGFIFVLKQQLITTVSFFCTKVVDYNHCFFFVLKL